MKHFLDFGTHKFEGLEEFIEKLGIDNTFSVQCFEPNKTIYESSRSMKSAIKKYELLFQSFKHINCAIMDYTGKITFNSHKGAWMDGSKTIYNEGYTTGSNCLDINPSFDSGNGVIFDIISETCDCIDVSQIIDEIIEKDKDAEIFIKCDIEGSEFVVLPRLLKSKYVNSIKNIYIEWHERFWNGTDEYSNKINQRKNIIDTMNRLNIRNFIHT